MHFIKPSDKLAVINVYLDQHLMREILIMIKMPHYCQSFAHSLRHMIITHVLALQYDVPVFLIYCFQPFFTFLRNDGNEGSAAYDRRVIGIHGHQHIAA